MRLFKVMAGLFALSIPLVTHANPVTTCKGTDADDTQYTLVYSPQTGIQIYYRAYDSLFTIEVGQGLGISGTIDGDNRATITQQRISGKSMTVELSCETR